MARARVGIDVGGTFTDLVALRDGEVVTAKVPSTPADQSEGVMAGLRAAAVDGGAVESLAHGTTVATNALLERKGARVALVTTEGFRDIIEIGRQNRPSLYDLAEDRPAALVPRDLRFTVTERTGRDGVIRPLDEASVTDVVDRLAGANVDSVAVCLLFSFLHPDHERRIGNILQERLPDMHVSLSSDVLPEFREYERASTTAADAYLAPKLSSYLTNLATKTQTLGVPAPLVMQSSGGIIDIEAASKRAAACVLSGPAGGVVGAAYVASLGGYDDVVSFDMGGTSTDVAPVVGGRVQTTTESIVAGVPIRFPMVDVHTVSAGGGSIAWVDEGGALRVGPHSAGAEPGPAAYAAGGGDATVTDANLCLGLLRDGARLGGEVVLHGALADKALSQLAERLNMTTEETARGVIRVANAEMVRALRVISVERGLDPRDLSLVAFGGAGPMHACALAEELGMRTVLVPKASGVLSALGLAISEVRRDYVRPYLAPVTDVDHDEIDAIFRGMEAVARAALSSPTSERLADLRYTGQAYEITVEATDLGKLAERFNDAHRRRFGYGMDDEPVEIVNVRLVATEPSRRPKIAEQRGDGRGHDGTRRAHFDGEWVETGVFARTRMGAGDRVEGPAIVEFGEATCVVRPCWSGAVDDVGTLVLERC